jgi:hypothetical protein
MRSTFYGYNYAEKVDENLNQIMEDLVECSYLKQIDDVSEPTRLGSACVAAGARPEDAKMLFEELDKAQKNFALDTELHLCYLVCAFQFHLG